MHPRAFHRPLVPSRSHDPETAFEPHSFDFVTYLSRRIGVDRELATEVLGHWLTHYEPAANSKTTQDALPPALQPAASRVEPRSGIFPAVKEAAIRATGTDS